MFNGGVFNSFVYNGTTASSGGSSLDVPFGSIENVLIAMSVAMNPRSQDIIKDNPAGNVYTVSPSQDIENDKPRCGII